MPATSERAAADETSAVCAVAAPSTSSAKTEIEDLHAAVTREKDVLGLEVAVHDPALVRRAKPARNLECHIECRVDGKHAGAQSRTERLAIEILGYQERGAAILPNVVDREHVRMIEGPGGACLLLAGAPALHVRGVRQEQLDRHVACEALVACPPHLPHRPHPEPSCDRV